MRILLIGEYSRLHNSLKEGLQQNGQSVILASSGDSFKKFPSDYIFAPKICNYRFFAKIRNVIIKIFTFDLEELERGIRFSLVLKHLKNFDVVQLINEKPIQTIPFIELYLLKKIFKTNKKVFLLSAGVDKISVDFMIDNGDIKSIMQPYFQDKSLRKQYDYVFNYLKKNHLKTHQYVYENCGGIIASDMDYVLPLLGNKKFLGMIPNPINIEKLENKKLLNFDRIIIFLGVNRGNYHQKGIKYFEEALKIIAIKYTEKVEIMVTENVAYSEYIQKYNRCHILLDQTFGYDQGYNALEAMAQGKVVFTGAETEFEKQYNLLEKVAINAKPDVAYLVSELSFLIENPNEIIEIGKCAQKFILQHHDYKEVAKKYLDVWNSN